MHSLAGQHAHTYCVVGYLLVGRWVLRLQFCCRGAYCADFLHSPPKSPEYTVTIEPIDRGISLSSTQPATGHDHQRTISSRRRVRQKIWTKTPSLADYPGYPPLFSLVFFLLSLYLRLFIFGNLSFSLLSTGKKKRISERKSQTFFLLFCHALLLPFNEQIEHMDWPRLLPDCVWLDWARGRHSPFSSISIWSTLVVIRHANCDNRIFQPNDELMMDHFSIDGVKYYTSNYSRSDCNIYVASDINRPQTCWAILPFYWYWNVCHCNNEHPIYFVLAPTRQYV